MALALCTHVCWGQKESVGPPADAHGAALVLQMGNASSNGQEAVAFSPDGAVVATGGGGTTWLWEVTTGLALRSFAGDLGVSFLPDGKSIFTSSRADGWIWDFRTGRQLRHFDLPPTTLVPTISPDGKIVAAGTDTAILLWNAATGVPLTPLALSDHKGLSSVAISHSGTILASGFNDGTLELWDIQKHALLKQSSAHQSDGKDSVTTKYPSGVSSIIYLYRLNQLIFSVDDHFLAGANEDGSAKAWDLVGDRYLGNIAVADSSLRSIAISPDGNSVLFGTYAGAVYLLNAKSSPQKQKTLRAPAKEKEAYSVAFSADGRYAIASSHDNVTQMWNVEDGTEVRRFSGATSPIKAIAADQTAQHVLIGGADSTARIWDLGTGQVQTLRGHTGNIASVAISSDGKRVATGSSDNTARIWDPVSGNTLHVLSGFNGWVNWMEFSADAKRLLTVSGDSVDVWDVSSAKSLLHLEVNNTDTAVLSKDAKIVYVVASDNEKVVVGSWDVETGLIGPELKLMCSSTLRNDVFFAALSPDGRELVTGAQLMGDDSSNVQVWDLQAGKVTQEISLRAWATSANFSSDGGSLLLTEGLNDNAMAFDFQDGRIQVGPPHPPVKGKLNTQEGDARTVFAGHAGEVSEAIYLGGDRWVLTASEDGTARLWDAKSGNWRLTLAGLERGGWVAIDPQGRFDTNDLDAAPPMHWVATDDPLHALPIEIFMRDDFTPGLLSSIWHSGEEGAAALPPIISVDAITNRIQPEISIVDVHPSRTLKGSVDLVVKAVSRHQQMQDDSGNTRMRTSGLQDLRLFRDGQMVGIGGVGGPNQTGEKLRRGGYIEGNLADGDYVFHDILLSRSAAMVTFTAYAFNSERIKSATASFDYFPSVPPSHSASKPHAYLLQIGVNQYVGNHCTLHYAVSDADAMSDALIASMSRHGYIPIAIKLVAPEKGDPDGASKQRIQNELLKIAAAATPDDVFFMTFSGHGYSDASESNRGFYLLPSGLTGSCREVDDALLHASISADELAQWLRPIDAGEMTLILDACDSAASVDSGGFKPGPLGSRGLGQLAYDKRMRVLAASQADESAQESDGLLHGVLTYALIQSGLTEHKADWRPVDQKITVREWLSFAEMEVPQYAFDPAQADAYKSAGPRFNNNRKTIQVPALFDFSKKDTLFLQ